MSEAIIELWSSKMMPFRALAELWQPSCAQFELSSGRIVCWKYTESGSHPIETVGELSMAGYGSWVHWINTNTDVRKTISKPFNEKVDLAAINL